MRLLALTDQRYKNSYTTCLYAVIEQTYGQQEYNIKNVVSLKEQTLPLPENAIIFALLTNVFNQPIRIIQQARLKNFIRKKRIDLFIQNMVRFIKQKEIPQLLIADDIQKLPSEKFVNQSNTSIITYSFFAKQVLIDKGFTSAIHIVPFTASPLFQPVSWSIKQQVKMDHTQGREYFFINRSFKSAESFLNVLKAFSGFKKWQHSGMKLIISGHIFIPPDDLNDKLSTYKYREDVVLYSKLGVEELVKIFAAAYAFIHLPETDTDILPLLQSMQCHTPVITCETASIKEYAANAVLTAASEDYEELTQKMILIYKDENLRNRLIQQSALQAGEFTQDHAMHLLQNVIHKACIS